jgi:hypothetical protein
MDFSFVFVFGFSFFDLQPPPDVIAQHRYTFTISIT